MDPLTSSYPWLTPYSFAENDVIRSIDLDGLESVLVQEIFDDWKKNYWTPQLGSGTLVISPVLSFRVPGRIYKEQCCNVQFIKDDRQTYTQEIENIGGDGLDNFKGINTLVSTNIISIKLKDEFSQYTGITDNYSKAWADNYRRNGVLKPIAFTMGGIVGAQNIVATSTSGLALDVVNQTTFNIAKGLDPVDNYNIFGLTNGVLKFGLGNLISNKYSLTIDRVLESNGNKSSTVAYATSEGLGHIVNSSSILLGAKVNFGVSLFTGLFKNVINTVVSDGIEEAEEKNENN